ncbi:MAG: hypothetical protein COA88_02885 [Kordia sp.]|nr:MAG: hypothetical protein COA88_02885 [Kordia sp.]
MKNYIISNVLFIFIIVSCNNKNINDDAYSFDNTAMLNDIGSQVVLPKITQFKTACENLNNTVQNYVNTPSENGVILMQTNWKEAAKAYAHIYAFNIGEAKSRYFHQALYNWPTYAIAIDNFIANSPEITAENVSQLSPQAKTLSGIEYLLFHSDITTIHNSFINENKRLLYLKFISENQQEKAADLYNLWQANGDNYLTTFINNTETGLSNSINMLFNGCYNVVDTAKVTKIGKSAGLENSNNVNLDELQARYSGYSKELIIENLKSVKEVFFNSQGLGLSNNISAITGNELLNNSLQNKIDTIIASLTNLNGTIAYSINNSPNKVREIHEQLQEILVVLAVDIRSALSIIITSTDNDGD